MGDPMGNAKVYQQKVAEKNKADNCFFRVSGRFFAALKWLVLSLAKVFKAISKNCLSACLELEQKT